MVLGYCCFVLRVNEVAAYSTSLAKAVRKCLVNPPALVAGGFSFKDTRSLDLK